MIPALAPQLPVVEVRLPAAQLAVIENEPANEARRVNALVIPPHIERIMMDPEAQQQDVNGAIVAGFGRFGAFLQNFEDQAHAQARHVGGQVRALVDEQNALQRRIEQEGPNNAALRENLRQVNERLRLFLEANPAPRVGELERRVNQLEVVQIQQRVAALEQPAPRPANQPDPVIQLQQRVAALEQPAPRPANQPDPLAQIQQRLAALEQPAPNPAAAAPAPNQAIPAPVLARLQRLEVPVDGRIREREKESREEEISRIKQRLLLNVAICERAAIAAGVLLVPSIAGNAISGGVLAGGIAGYISKTGLRQVIIVPSVSLLVFAGFTATTIATGMLASAKATRLQRSRDLLQCFNTKIKSGLTPQVALQKAQVDINKKYNS